MTDKVLVDLVSKMSRHQALLELDMDPAAERFTIIDRRSLLPLFSGVRPTTGIAKVLLPLELATANHCLVGIIDDNGVYNAKFVDGVQLQLVDALTVDMSQ